MLLNIDIPHLTAPALKTPRVRIVFRTPRGHLLKPIVSRLNAHYQSQYERSLANLNRIILSLEGSYNHLKDISPKEALSIQADTEKSITKVLAIKDKRIMQVLLKNNDEYRFKYNLMLKWLYKIESRCHVIAYREEPIIKTDQELKDGVINLNSSYLNRADAL